MVEDTGFPGCRCARWEDLYLGGGVRGVRSRYLVLMAQSSAGAPIKDMNFSLLLWQSWMVRIESTSRAGHALPLSGQAGV